MTIRRFLTGRLLSALGTVLVSSMVVFVMVRLIPGNPILVLLGQAYSPKVAAALRATYGLNRPIVSQYVSWLAGLLHGDFGYSIMNQAPIAEQLGQRIVRTLELLAGGLAIGMGIALPSGLIAARHRGRTGDLVVMNFTTAMLAIPQFVLGILLILVFGVLLKWLPAGGWISPSVNFTLWLKSMILPWLTIGLTMSAFTARVFRSSVLDQLARDYVRTARSWGLSDWRLTFSHVIRNAAIPTITVIGLEIGYLLGGSIVVENVFAYPGMGQYLVQAIQNRDYPVVQAGVLTFALGFVLVNLMVDLLYGAIDPRARVAK